VAAKVLIVEENEMNRDMISRRLQRHRHEVEPAADGLKGREIAHAMGGDRESALETGCDEYDTKPIEFRHLLSKIESLLTARVRT
jgi:CheY-like chemotaxis protein